MTLNHTKVVVVGGSSGIGLGVARAAVAEGAEVVLVGRSPEKLLEASRALGDPPSVKTITVDITREEDVARAFAETGAFDHLVVTAANLAYAPIASFDLAAARACVESKLVAAILLAKHACGRVKPGGSLTFTSGQAKDRARPKGAVVAAVNGALGSLARALAVEMAPTRVNVVSPGVVDTPIWTAIVGDDKGAVFEQTARRLPVGRIGTTADLAQAYLFLMQNEFTTGTTLHVDGGYTLV
jgi:NAD(P)-dependent dehydrogenase (short-subunit alcohol dehydrogenase family)